MDMDPISIDDLDLTMDGQDMDGLLGVLPSTLQSTTWPRPCHRQCSRTALAYRRR